MIFKLLIFGFLSSCAIQAFPVEPETITPSPQEDKEKLCEKELLWYGDATIQIQEVFDKYYDEYKQLKKANNSNTSYIEAEHNEFEHKVTDAIERYQDSAKKISNISDDTIRMAFCMREVNWYRVLDQNLTNMAKHMKTDVLHFLDAVGVPKEVKEDFDRDLSRLVSYLLIMQMTKNISRDVKSIAKEAYQKIEDKIKLEKNYEFIKNNELPETALDINEDYREAMEENEADKELKEDLMNLSADEEIVAAKERMAERVLPAGDTERYENGEEANGMMEEEAMMEFRPFFLK